MGGIGRLSSGGDNEYAFLIVSAGIKWKNVFWPKCIIYLPNFCPA